jgi:hypothetical protein
MSSAHVRWVHGAQETWATLAQAEILLTHIQDVTGSILGSSLNSQLKKFIHHFL